MNPDIKDLILTLIRICKFAVSLFEKMLQKDQKCDTG